MVAYGVNPSVGWWSYGDVLRLNREETRKLSGCGQMVSY